MHEVWKMQLPWRMKITGQLLSIIIGHFTHLISVSMVKMTNARYDTNQKSTSIYTSHFLFYFILITQKFIIFWPCEMIRTFTFTLSLYWVNLFKLFMKCLVLLIPVMFCKKDWLEQYNNDFSSPYNISCIRIISYLGSSHCSNSKNVPVGHYLDMFCKL